MKHFTLVLAALMTASAAMAVNAPVKARKAANPHKIVNAQAQARMKQAPALNLSARQLELPLQGTRVDLGKSRAEEGPIWEAEGPTQMYTVKSVGFTVFFGQLWFDESESMKEIVWAEDGTVYIKNLLSLGFDTYVKGEVADNKITVKLPQMVYAEEWEDEIYTYSLTVTEYNEEVDEDGEIVDAGYYNVSDDKNVLEFQINEDGSLTMQVDPSYVYDEEDADIPTYIVSVVEDTTPGVNDWLGYGDAIQTYTEFNMEAAVLPEDAEVEQWAMVYNNEDGVSCSQFVNIAFCGDKVYLGGFDEDFVDAWAVGTLADGKVTFDGGQYLMYSDLWGMPFYFLTGTFSEVYLEDLDWWDIHVEFTDGITMVYDEKNKTLKAEDPESCIVINAKLDELYFLYLMVDPMIKWQTPDMYQAKPLNPECIYYMPWDPDYYGGQGEIVWNIPALNEKGCILQTERMFYNFLVDGEVYALDPEEYPNIDELMINIPYDFNDGEDIWAVGEEHDIYFYFDGAESYGLQSFYMDDEGTIWASDIVTYIPETEGIDSVKAVQVVDTKYTDLMGRQIANPTNGLYIKTMKLANGSTRSVKVMVK